MGVSSSESHDLTAFYELLTASFGVLSQNTGFYPSLDRIVETMLGPLNLGPGGGAYNEPISCLHRADDMIPNLIHAASNDDDEDYDVAAQEEPDETARDGEVQHPTCVTLYFGSQVSILLSDLFNSTSQVHNNNGFDHFKK